MSYRCHGAVFRAPHESAVAAFDDLADQHLGLDLIRIRDEIFGVRVMSALANNRIERQIRHGDLDQMASNLSQRFHVAFTVWYDSIFGGFKFSVFVQGRQYASLRTDNGQDDDQWLDANGAAYEFGPPQVLAGDGSLLARPLPTLLGPRDAGRDCDLSVAASILGIESLGADDEDLFRWDSVFPAIKRNYS